MKSKNCIIFKNKNKCIYSGGGLFQKGLHQNPSLLFKHVIEAPVNNPTFGRISGPKTESDNVKIGSFNSMDSLAKPSIPTSSINVANALKSISFKTKKKNTIKLTI